MKSTSWVAGFVVTLLLSIFAVAKPSDANQPQVKSSPQPDSGSVSAPVPGGVNTQGFTVSVTSLEAPEKAKKAFNKGEQEIRKGRWQAACDYFKSAVAMYPRYALAWLELGRTQVRQNSFVEANESFKQAVTQDSKLTDGYVELARVAAQQKNWKELADTTEKLIQIEPESSPEYWFLNAAAYYNLADLERAETRITHGLRLDGRHQIPQMEYLYGLILGDKKDYKSAAEHIDAYLRLAPDSEDAEAARNARNAYLQRAQLVAAQADDSGN